MDDDFSIFYGFGSCFDLRDAARPRLPLEGMKSVKNPDVSLRPRTQDQRQPIGFHRPRS